MPQNIATHGEQTDTTRFPPAPPDFNIDKVILGLHFLFRKKCLNFPRAPQCQNLGGAGVFVWKRVAIF